MARGGADVINANAGDDTVTYQGTETSIDGGTGSDTLVLAATGGITAVNFAVAAGADQTTGDSVVVANFENLNAAVATSALTVQGSSAVNVITTGSGNDTIDGGGGADIIVAGGGDDTVSYRSTEFSIDGGTGTNTLLLRAVTTVDLGSADQTLGDVVTVTNFQNVDASQLVSGVSITGSAGTNVLTGGAGNDTIDGAGGADIIAAGAGADTVTYHGTEASIDGGTGSDTLVMAVSGGTTAVNLAVAAGTDQTIGDVVGVTNFENLDASALSTALTVTGSSSANVITTGSGNDTIDGGGGADVIAAGAGDDSVVYRGTEVSIDGGSGTNTLVMNVATTINLGNIDQSTGDVTAITNFQNVDASALSAAVSITGDANANTIIGGSGADTIDGGGGADIISAGAGDDTVSYRGTEVSIDGQAGTNTLLLRAAATVNLANADQTTGDSTTVANFQNVDASLLSTGVTITGSSGVNLLTGSSGNDTIDGGGGGDTIVAGAGNDTVIYRGTEMSIDGGNGSDTLVLSTAAGITSVNFAVAAGLDQTVGDTVSVANFENLDASALSSALTVTGSAAANTITTGSGNDTIDGGGGADVISSGDGNDTVYYYGAETSIDGGNGTNTLILRAATTVNLANADQTSGDTTTVANFQNVDASSLAIGVSLTGSAGANMLTGGAGNDTIDGGGGADVIATGGGDDIVTYHGTETSIDAGSGVDTLVMVATGGTTAVNFSVTAGSDQTTGDTTAVANFENLDASALTTGITVTGSTSANVITTGSGNDTIDGNGGGDTINAGAGNDTVAYWGTETSIDGGTGNNTLLMKVAGTVNLASADQTSGDISVVTNFQNVDASGLTSGASITGSSGVNIITGGSGNDSVDGGGGADVISARRWQRQRHLSRHGSLDRRRLGHRHAQSRRARRHHRGGLLGHGRDRPDHRRHRHRHQFREPQRLGRHHGLDRHRLHGRQQHHDGIGRRHHRRQGRQRHHRRRRRQRHGELLRDRELARRRHRHQYAGPAGGGHDQPGQHRPDHGRPHDGHELPERQRFRGRERNEHDRLVRRQHHHRRFGRRRHRRRGRRRHDRRRRRQRLHLLSLRRHLDQRRIRHQHADPAQQRHRQPRQCGPDDGRHGHRQQFPERQRQPGDRAGLDHGLVGCQHDHGQHRRRHDRRRRRRRRDRCRQRQRHRDLSRHGSLDRRQHRLRQARAGCLRRHHGHQPVDRLRPDDGRHRRCVEFRERRRRRSHHRRHGDGIVLGQHHHDRLRRRHHSRRRRRRRDRRGRGQRHRRLLGNRDVRSTAAPATTRSSSSRCPVFPPSISRRRPAPTSRPATASRS